MADNDPKEYLVSKEEKENSSGSQSKIDTLVPTLLILFTSSGMCIAGLGYALEIFNIRGFFWGFIILGLVAVTYWVNQRVITRACHESGKHSYSKIILHYWGRKRGLTLQIAMAVHNILIIAYLQQRVAAHIYGVFHEDGDLQYTDAFYYVAIANIGLILLALQTSFARVRWFAIIGILVWVYLFIGVITEGFSNDSIFSESGAAWPEPDMWMLTSIGVLAYFMSSFQVVPFLHGEVKNEVAMISVVNRGAIGSAVLVVSVFLYYAFNELAELNFLRHGGIVLIGSCVTIINVLPTREFIVQILQEDAKDKQKTRDRFITLFILTFTLFFSIFYVHRGNWQGFVGIGTILTSILGFIFPAVLFYRIAKDHENKKKIILLVWNIIFGITVFAAGIVMMMIVPCQGRQIPDGCGTFS